MNVFPLNSYTYVTSPFFKRHHLKWHGTTASSSLEVNTDSDNIVEESSLSGVCLT